MSDTATPLEYREAGTAIAKPEPTLARRAMSGSAYTLVAYGITNVIRLVSNAILTHLLVPEMFGLMTLVNTILIGIRMLTDVGIGSSLIRHPDAERESFLRTAFTAQVIRGLGMSCLAVAFAWPVAQFYGEADMLTILPIAGAIAIVEGFRSTNYFRLLRHLRLLETNAIEVGNILLQAIIMVVWAYYAPTIWALVIPGIIASIVQTVVTHLVIRDRVDRFGWDKPAAVAIGSFGKWVFVSTLMTFLAGMLDRLIFAKLIPLELLGVYGIAAILATMPTQALMKVGSSVIFPAFASIQTDPARFAAIFPKVRFTMLILAGALVSGLVACAPALVNLLYAGPFVQAGWMTQLLALSVMFQLLEVPNSSALLAAGKPKWLAMSTAAKVVAMFVFLPLGYRIGGADGLAYGILALGLCDLLRYVASVIGIARLNLGVRLVPTDMAIVAFTSAIGLGTMWLLAQLPTKGAGVHLLLGALIVTAAWGPLFLGRYKAIRASLREGKSASAPVRNAVDDGV